MNDLMVKVENINGVLVTTSNRVAEELGVTHRDLCEKIDGYVKKFQSAELSADFYIPSNYKDSRNRTYRNYLITKKGIAQLIGGYSSAVEKAFDLNVAYINRFEEMEKQLGTIVSSINQELKKEIKNVHDSLENHLKQIEDKFPQEYKNKVDTTKMDIIKFDEDIYGDDDEKVKD